MKASRQIKGSLFAISGGCCWGMSGCVGQYLFTVQNMDSKWLVPIRLFLAGLIIFAYYLVKNPKQLIEPWKQKRTAIELLIYGILGVGLCQLTYFWTIQFSSAGTATIIQNVSPVMILMVVCIAKRRRPRIFEVVSLLLALIGVFLITTHGSLTQLVISPYALIIGIISAACVVVYTLTPRTLQRIYPTSLMQGWAFFMSGIVFAFILKPWDIDYTPNVLGILGILFVVIVGNIMAFTTYMTGVKYIGAQRSSLFGFAEPVVAAIISTAFLGSTFTIWDAFGFGCIFVMMFLLVTKKA